MITPAMAAPVAEPLAAAPPVAGTADPVALEERLTAARARRAAALSQRNQQGLAGRHPTPQLVSAAPRLRRQPLAAPVAASRPKLRALAGGRAAAVAASLRSKAPVFLSGLIAGLALAGIAAAVLPRPGRAPEAAAPAAVVWAPAAKAEAPAALAAPRLAGRAADAVRAQPGGLHAPSGAGFAEVAPLRPHPRPATLQVARRIPPANPNLSARNRPAVVRTPSASPDQFLGAMIRQVDTATARGIANLLRALDGGPNRPKPPRRGAGRD